MYLGQRSLHSTVIDRAHRQTVRHSDWHTHIRPIALPSH